MRTDFSQTAEHCISGTIDGEVINNLPEAIRRRTGLRYTCTKTDGGCLLQPTFRSMYFRNSFTPEIDVRISENIEQTALFMTGRPVKAVLYFMRFWFVALLIFEIFMVIAVVSGAGKVFGVFVPVIMAVFGYLLCEIATKVTFHIVVKAIQKELPD